MRKDARNVILADIRSVNVKIYTKTGDKGQTSLFGARRVSKDDIRVAAYGSIDEINSSIGFLTTQLTDISIQNDLRAIQSDLLTIGAYLAGAPEELGNFELRIKSLENAIDGMETQLEKLTNFILPGGTAASASAHVVRSTVRRAERSVVALGSSQTIDKRVLEYLNRLSDYFFVLARFINKQAGIDDIIWRERK